MKFRKEIINQLNNFPCFSKEALTQLCSKHGLSLHTVDSYINKSLKEKEIISLKKGLYVTKDFYNKNIHDIGYKFYLANIIRKPSYISSWSALDYYGMTTDVIMATTSVTTKVTRTYSTKIGGFIYKSMKKELFSGFSLIKSESGFSFFIASPAKALFDLLYSKTNQFRSPKKDIIEDLRIDIDEMSKPELKKFKKLLKDNNILWKIL